MGVSYVYGESTTTVKEALYFQRRFKSYPVAAGAASANEHNMIVPVIAGAAVETIVANAIGSSVLYMITARDISLWPMCRWIRGLNIGGSHHRHLWIS